MRRAIGLGVAAAASGFAAAPASTPWPELPNAISSQPAVVAFAKTHGIPLDGIEPPSASETGRVGDAFTALVTLREGKSQKQWLTRFQVVERTAEERTRTGTEIVTSTFNGRETRFTATREMALWIRTAGPFIEGKKSVPTQKEARALTSPAFLRLGFDKASRALAEFFLANASLVVVGEMAEHPTPVPSAATPAAPPATTPSEPTEQTRAIGGLFPTLSAFFGSIENTPGLRDILWDIVDKPSVWSLAKHRGISPGFNLNGALGTSVNIQGWGVADGTSLYEFGFELHLNDKPALLCRLFVTSPRPPLLASAGVIGIIAESPNRTKRLDIRVVAAHRGPVNRAAIASESGN